MHINPAVLYLAPDRFKTQEMCIKALKVDPWRLEDVPHCFKTQDMCDKTVRKCPSSLMYALDWFVTQQQIKMWRDGDEYCDDDDDDDDDDELIKWYEDYQKRRAHKARIEKELMPIAWHTSRWWSWCIPEDEKKGTKKSWK